MGLDNSPICGNIIKMKILSIKTGQYGERPVSRVRLFIETKDESVAENLMARMFGHSAPYKTYRQEVLPRVFKKLKIDPAKVSWSQKAGCSCGCSPGYVLDINPTVAGFEAVWVTIGDTKSRKWKE